MTNAETIQKLAAQMAAEQDPVKKGVIRQRFLDAVNAEKAAKKAAEDKAAEGPLYPVGLSATYEGKSATITQAHKDEQGIWRYSVDVKAGMPFEIGDGVYQLSEPELRQEMVNRFNASLSPGQAYSAGMLLSRNGVCGLIEKAYKSATGDWLYSVAGWSSPVTQRELLGILVRG